MEIIVNRQSVCMGDDVDDHSKVYNLNDDVTYEELFYQLKKDRYFPSVSGNNVVWVLTTKKIECIFSYFTMLDKFSVGLTEKKMCEICKDTNKVFFKYYSSPEMWKNKIYAMYNNDTYSMWRDGWLEEVKYCDYLSSLGK